jgi:hypothetical protein
MGELTATPTQWANDNASGARDEILRSRKKAPKKTSPGLFLKPNNGSNIMLEIETEPESEMDRKLDILA